ncbi:Si-specific NAD(P)(+) transhydrogenase [Arboricoccus pini]|uniref:Si-specific NAD(P)(+) transhydrogenase n=1 Tax=Arboricoccus pini TaxID=1963835 RepID=UPI000B501042|nr:Si-specific NAD(P)(+) transhydrogenase [Arboricoccus pini]
MQAHYDFIVIGSGPAGRRAAVQAAKLGKSVLVVDKGRRVGGVSVHTGTIPSKTLRETVLNLSGWRERGFYGRSYRVKKDIAARDLRDRLLITLNHEVEVLEQQFARNRVESLRATARFLDPQRIEVEMEAGERHELTAGKYLLAVGTRPYRPTNVPFDGKRIIDSDEILEIATLPRSLAVVGAGVIGVEYATIFSALDVPVTLIEPRTTMLDFVDREIVDDFIYDLRDRGVALRMGVPVQTIERADDHCLVRMVNGRAISTEMILYTAGRVGATDTLNLEAIGLDTDARGRVTVDRASFETSVPGIYAAGDVIGFPSLASTALEQGRIAALHAFGHPTATPDAEHFPYGIYAVPEISTVGLSEQDVIKQGIAYECGVARLRETSRGHIMGLTSGMMKMIVSLEDRRVLGVHIVGEGATELIHIGQAVINLKGTVDYFVQNTFNYPTLAEAYKIAALDAWNRMTR